MIDWADVAAKTISALAVAGVGALVGNAWQRRRTSARELFLLLRQAFSRPAFRGPFTFQSDQAAFREAIAMTLKTVETGKYVDRRGGAAGELQGRYRGPFSLRNSDQRKVLEDVSARLQNITHLSARLAAGAPETKEDLAGQIDRERDAVIGAMNSVWEALGIPPMALPTSVKVYDETQDPRA